ncbi:MAG: hypothetical protein REH83_04450 [Rickettsiella sp.]|nr:hypothetical protein [Rickettsiella sp.]
MTTSISLDQSKHLVQSFDELIRQAADLCQHIDDLKTEITSQIKKLENHFKRAERLCGSGIVPLFDMENLYQFIMDRLSKFNTLLDKLSEEKRRFELILRDYEITLRETINEVSHA